MGNGFPIGGVLIAPHFEARPGLLEVGFDQAERVAELLRAAGCETACHEDYQHILRMVEARWA